MQPDDLQRTADQVVQRALEQLPESIRQAAEDCRVELVTMAVCVADGETLEDGLLGLFEGCPRGGPLSESPDQFPHIRLFLDNLWDYSGGDLRVFRDEVRITFLHELGHYLGFDDAAVEELGLG